MLKIRLSRHGRKKAPFYRIVLTEHTKPAKSGYQTVLGWFNPLAHTMEAKIDEIKAWIAKGAQPSERVAKLLFAKTKDDFFKKFFVERTRTKGKEAEDAKKAEVEAKAQAAKEKAAAEKEAAAEAKKAEAEAKAAEEAKPEEVKEETKETAEETTENTEAKEEAKSEQVEEIKEEAKEEKSEAKEEAKE